MEMLLGFIVLLVCLIVGVRHGGLGLAVISGFGLVIYTFIFGYQPGKPPIDVMLIILAVVTCAGFLQTSGGLTVMLKYAEKFLRNNPKHVTILAPLTTWFLTVLCGYGARRLYDVPDHLRYCHQAGHSSRASDGGLVRGVADGHLRVAGLGRCRLDGGVPLGIGA